MQDSKKQKERVTDDWRQEAAMGRCVVVLGADPAITENKIPGDFSVGEA